MVGDLYMTLKALYMTSLKVYKKAFQREIFIKLIDATMPYNILSFFGMEPTAITLILN